MNSDKKLILAYQKQGNIAAFKSLYEKYTSEMIRYTQLSFPNQSHRNDVEDIVQDTWVKILKSNYKCENNASFRTYLYTILENKIKDYQRSKNAKKRQPEKLLVDIIENDENLEPIIDDINIITLEEAYSWQEIALKLDYIINQLPEEQKKVLLLYYYKEYKIREISEELNLPIENIKSKLRLAKQKIARSLQNQI